MNRFLLLEAVLCLSAAALLTGCGQKVSAADTSGSGTGPVPTQVEPDMDTNNFRVDHPDRFPLATAADYVAAPDLNVTGVVQADVSRQVPVPSLATGRIVEINARLGDAVTKGQLLFRVRSPDVAGAYSNYRQAIKNEELTKVQLERANLLLEHGAIPKSQQEIAQNAEDDNVVVLETTREQLGLLGLDPEHPGGAVNVFAPTSGTITDQQIVLDSAVQSYSTPAPFTISDMSHVWIVCDVWENDMSQVRVGEFTDIHLAAYPDRVLKGRIGNILPVVDPNIRTAKVRIEVENPGLMRLGMFVTATFHGISALHYSQVPATAILHLKDREWVYKPLGQGRFKRLEVTAGSMLPNQMQQVVSGLSTGDQVVLNALVFQNTVEQ